MKKHIDLARGATEILAEAAPSSMPASTADENDAIHAMEAAITASYRRRRAHTAMLGSLAVAAVIALGVVAWRGAHSNAPIATLVPSAAPVAVAIQARPVQMSPLSDGVSVVRLGREPVRNESVALQPTDRVMTASDARASITLATGSHLALEAGSDLALVEEGMATIFALASGSVRADVAKLHAGERFVVRTPDGEVEVRGTSFDVSIASPSATCGGGTVTRVAVYEGVVVVRAAGAATSVAKGDTWPHDCAPASKTTALAPSPIVSGATTVPAKPLTTSSVSTPSPSERVAASDLAAQNALYAEASAARRRGDNTAALAAYDRLIAQYPASPLAENAYVERMRVLSVSDPRYATESARAYLARYPHGFARAEASALLAKQR